MEIWYLLITEKFLFWTFPEWEIRSFFRQKVSEKIIFTDYWNVRVLNFLEMENMASFWGKKLMERCYLLVTENFLFWAFPLWEIRFFCGKNVMERWYLLITEKFLFWATEKFLLWAFWWWEIRSFFSQKVDVKVIFTCSFWTFHDIPGPGKYCFLCSVSLN